MDPTFSGKRVVAVIPHQDDEVIGMGGHLAHACRVAKSVHLVLVTDGAACGGVKCLRGLWPCYHLATLGGEPGQGLEQHDALLVRGEDGYDYHPAPHHPPFDIIEDRERAPGTASIGWGKQRDYEFLHVAQALGIPRRNIIFAYWDPYAPDHIKDGQIAIGDTPLTPEQMSARYARVAEHYLRQLRPDIVITMAPYEYMAPPNDHWAGAVGVTQAARAVGCERIQFNHSGVLYQHIFHGGEGYIGQRVELPPDIWEIKRRALNEYMRWDPAGGWFATAAHSVAETFRALLAGGCGRFEYFSTAEELGF